MNHNCLVPGCTNVVSRIDSYYCDDHHPKRELNEPKLMSTEGVKFDNGKPRYDLLPVIGLIRQAHVYGIGSKKYQDHNWRKGLKWSRVLRAMLSHLFMYMAGEAIDPKDGQHHLASVAWGCNTLMEYEYTHPELDDRYKAIPIEELRELLEELFPDSEK